jgi:sarcosine oxidase subunit gamma
VLDRLTIEPRTGLGIASVMARSIADPTAISTHIGLAPPNGPRAVWAGKRTILGTGPGTWLLLEEEAPADFADVLQKELAGLASVADQSSAYNVHRLTGADARRLLQRGAAIDFHPDGFGPGAAASTLIAHIGVMLWQVDDRPTYDIAMFRSYTESFIHWLDEACAAL